MIVQSAHPHADPARQADKYDKWHAYVCRWDSSWSVTDPMNPTVRYRANPELDFEPHFLKLAYRVQIYVFYSFIQGSSVSGPSGS